mmetsp:Transcript_131308/g.280840  ORF Transcript_131308/g.280840 Transcript_131308/m.280840 type:complete len:209 (-) Transcript_131308:83-709(-)
MVDVVGRLADLLADLLGHLHLPPPHLHAAPPRGLLSRAQARHHNEAAADKSGAGAESSPPRERLHLSDGGEPHDVHELPWPDLPHGNGHGPHRLLWFPKPRRACRALAGPGGLGLCCVGPLSLCSGGQQLACLLVRQGQVRHGLGRHWRNHLGRRGFGRRRIEPCAGARRCSGRRGRQPREETARPVRCLSITLESRSEPHREPLATL